MTKSDVLTLLEENKNERGIEHWGRVGLPHLTSFGLGLTQIKKLAKQVGKNHDLALELWGSGNYDAMTMATLIDEPKKVTREQVEEQANDLSFWMLSHAYCGNLLAKVPFAVELSDEYRAMKDDLKRRCGYALIYHIAKNNKKLTDNYFEPILEKIESDIDKEENFVKDAMNNALFTVGQRSKNLYLKAKAIAEKNGKIHVDYGDNSCEALDVVKHLNGDRIKNKMMA